MDLVARRKLHMSRQHLELMTSLEFRPYCAAKP